MATVTKTWNFASDAEGFVDVGDTGKIAFEYDSSTGYPSSGSVRFNQTFNGSSSERARTGTGVTWETWGVPAGSTVTSANITFYAKKNMSSGFTSVTFKARILNSSDTTVHSAGDIYSATISATTWGALYTGTSRNIDSSYQASSTNVKMEIAVDPITTTTALSRYLNIDTIVLTITYTTSSATAKNRRTPENNRLGSRSAK